ncbi:MAG: Rieske 2Fe-2S domain-containing protein [Acidobacteriota bacterium]|nr:Rieske 2Fe-2S domain-containing protein [Acidobacteriota bacterium]
MAFERVASVGEIAPGKVQEVQIGGKTLAVANVDGKIYAISNTCLHRGGPLGQGTLSGTVITCPWHGWSFDVINGKLSHNHAAGVACYPVEVRGEEVFADLTGS